METQSTPAQEPSKAKKSTKKEALAPSPILGVSPTARAADIDAAYKNYAAQVQARHTAATNIAQRDASVDVQAHHRKHEEVRKALKKGRTADLRDAQAAKVAALRKAQSNYDLTVNEIEAENERAVTEASHTFNEAVAPIHAELTAKKAAIDAEASQALEAAKAEFVLEKAKAEARVRAEAEAKKAADAQASTENE